MQRTHDELREALIKGAIKAVGENGVESLTTRLICKDAGVNEAYIYRYFYDKEDLLKRAFLHTDAQLAKAVWKEFSATDFEKDDMEEKLHALLGILWNSFMDDKQTAMFYYSFYYSRMMINMMSEHYDIWVDVLDSFKRHFPNSVNMHRLTDVILECIVNYAAKVHMGLEENTPEVRRIACSLAYPLIAKAIGISQEP